jgi:hypothetical protein
MVLLPDMGKIEVPHPIILVKTEQQFTVPYRNVAGHG